MFADMKGRLHSIQEDISHGFQKLGISHSKIPVPRYSDLNHYTGGDILCHYQDLWSEMHTKAEENANLAQKVDQYIKELWIKCDTSHKSVSNLKSHTQKLPELIASIERLSTKLGTLECLFDEIETDMAHLEDLVEAQELREKELDRRFKATLHREKRQAEYEQFKSHLAVQHAAKVKRVEEKQQALLKERHETFSKVFEEEMLYYRTVGKIQTRVSDSESSRGGSKSLDDVTLEQDSADLDVFLGGGQPDTETNKTVADAQEKGDIDEKERDRMSQTNAENEGIDERRNDCGYNRNREETIVGDEDTRDVSELDTDTGRSGAEAGEQLTSGDALCTSEVKE